MTDYQFIKGFQDIKMNNICKKLNIKQSNLTSGQTTEENYRRVKNEIIRELLVLMIQEKQEDLITLGLYDEMLARLEKENKLLREMI